MLLFMTPLFISSGMAAAESSAALRIHRYAAFNSQPLAGSEKPSDPLPGTARQRTRVNVYGSQMLLNLENNARLSAALPDNRRIALLRGTLEGKQHSWVRLTRTANGTHGLIWDGAELYVVEPGNEVRNALAISLPAPGSDSVIFKLSDTTVDLGTEYCGSATSETGAATSTGLATYQALAAELSTQTASMGNEPPLRLEMQALADAAFRAQYDSDQAALDAIMVRLNNVDGIFTAQMNLEVQATDIQLYASDPAPLSSSTDAGTLLNSVGQLRNAVPGMSSYAVTHLFTGRDLDGDILGVAYIGSICSARYGASLSEIRNRGAWIDSLVAAHELGHQLGAVHDGNGVCADTVSQGYLMSAQINGSSKLSQCSRDTIFSMMQRAACLVPVGAPDISIADSPAQLQVAAGTSLQWSLPIRNVGSGRADSPTVQVALPGNVIVEDSAIAGGSCIGSNDNTGGRVDCQFDTLAANETRLLHISLHSNEIGSHEIYVNVAAAYDDNPVNDSAIFNLTVGNETIASGAVSADAAAPAKRGGGGAFGWGWLLLGGGVHLQRKRTAPSRQNAAQPLHQARTTQRA